LFEADRDRLSEMRGSGPMPWRPQAIANGRVALVGDAAGYLEPITGEGMHWAMEAAAALAETVTGRPAGTWNDRMARAYSAGWRARLAGGQRTCAWLGWLLRHQTMCRAAFAIMNRDQGLAQRLADRVVTT
jgi:flavin-dependent dehydrogenase